MLTDAQKVTLKADIDADPEFSLLPNTPDDNFYIAAVYSLEASPDFYVWMSISIAAMKQGMNWAELTTPGNMSAEQRWAFDTLTNNHVVDANDSNTRSAFATLFSDAPLTLAAVAALAKRLALRVEKLFAVGTGTQGNPAETTHIGPISHQDVTEARNL